MPKLVIVQGIPCSGKTTWIMSQYGNRLNYVLSRDDIRIELNPQGKYKFDPKVEDVVTSIFNKRFNRYLSWKYNIYIDNTNLKPRYYQKFVERAEKEGYEIEFKKFPISLWKAQYRNIIRYIKTGKYIPWNVMKNMYKAYKKLK